MKTVLLPIKVPDCDYCKTINPDDSDNLYMNICPEFDSYSFRKCMLGLGNPVFIDFNGWAKPDKCKNLIRKVGR